MDSFEQVLPKLVKIQLFADFNPESQEDQRVLKAVYDNLSIQKFKAGEKIKIPTKEEARKAAANDKKGGKSSTGKSSSGNKSGNVTNEFLIPS